MNEQPSTGYCEQCGRRQALLIPAPGSGDLELDRLGEVFGWCARCALFVGRSCCWGPGQGCVRCAKARAGEAGRFAALGAARAAVRQLDGTAAEFSAVEDAIAKIDSADADAAMAAWWDGWLAAGVLRTRIVGSYAAATSWLRELPAAEAERGAELEAELGTVTTALEARWQSVAEVLAAAGMRLAAREAGAEPRPGRRGRRGRAAPEPTSLPVGAVPVTVPVPILPPDPVSIGVAAESQEPLPSASDAPTAPATSNPSSAPAVAARSSVAAPHAPVSTTAAVAAPGPKKRAPRSKRSTAPAPTLAAAAAEETLRRPSSRPVARSQREERLAATAQALPEAAPSAAPAPREQVASGNAGRRRGAAAAALVAIVGVSLAGAILAGVIGPIGRDSDEVGDRDPAQPAAVDGASSATPAPSPATPTSTPTPPATMVTVDLHPVGPLDPEELPFTRIIGAPEVAAFPTPFDRSLRLTGTAAGFCIALSSPSEGGASSLAFDLYLGKSGGIGRLAFALPQKDAASATGLGLDLAAFAQLNGEAWYRLTVTGEGATGRVEVTPVGDDRPVLEAELGSDATLLPIPNDEVCIHSSLQSSEASVLVDNLRVDR